MTLYCSNAVRLIKQSPPKKGKALQPSGLQSFICRISSPTGNRTRIYSLGNFRAEPYNQHVTSVFPYSVEL